MLQQNKFSNNNQNITLFIFSFMWQLLGPSLFHVWHSVRLWLLICLPALVGHPGPLLPPTPGPGQWGGDSWCQPLLHGHPGFPSKGGGAFGTQQDLPDPQPLHASAGLAGTDVQTFTACWRRHGTPRHGPSQSPKPARGHCSRGKQVEQGSIWGQKVLQPARFSHCDVPGVGVWSSHSCFGLLCAIYPSGKDSNGFVYSQIKSAILFYF